MPLQWIAAGRFHIRTVTRKEYTMSDKDKKKTKKIKIGGKDITITEGVHKHEKKPKKKPTKLKDKLKKIK